MSCSASARSRSAVLADAATIGARLQFHAAPYCVRRIEAVGSGHAQIHHDEIGRALARSDHRLLTVRGEQHLEADRLEHLPQQHAILRLIVHREHAQPPARS